MDNQDIDFALVDTSLLRSPNDTPSSFVSSDNNNAMFDDVSIPKSSDDVVDPPHSGVKIDSKSIISLLEIAASTQGVVVNDMMSNTALALAYKYGIDANSMEWFLAGITYANNNMLMEKMTSAIKDLQVEVRNIQLAANNTKQSSDEFMSKMKANKSEMIKEMDKTRDAVLSSLGSILPHEDNDWEEPKMTTVLIQKKPKGKSKAEKPQAVNPALVSPVLTKVISTKSPDDQIREQKEKLMLDLGFEVSEVGALDSIMLDLIITDDMLDMASDGLDDKTRSLLLDIAVENQITYQFVS